MPTSTPIGVYANLIEHWLTNTPERGFEVPFAQLLTSEGHTVFHIDPHHPMEQGKDLLARDPDRELCAYQLKGGQIDNAQFSNEILPQLRLLVKLPCMHPSVKDRMAKPYLVVTRDLTPPALQAFRQFNTRCEQEGDEPVTLITKSELWPRFHSAASSVIPTDPAGFARFLKHYLRDGREYYRDGEMSELLETLLPASATKLELRRRSASFGLVASQSFVSAIRAENHASVFFHNASIGLHYLYVAAARGSVRTTLPDEVAIFFDAAEESLARLVHEVGESRVLVSGSVLGDGGAIYRSRLTIILGLVALYELLLHFHGISSDTDSASRELIRKHWRDTLIWGESAGVWYFFMSWFLGLRGDNAIEAENLIVSYLRSVASQSARSGKGVPMPFLGVIECLGQPYEPDYALVRTTYRHRTYTAVPAVDWLVRRLRRNALKMFWEDIADCSHAHFEFRKAADAFRHRATEGREISSFFDRPQSWVALQTRAREAFAIADRELPKVLVKNIPVLLFLLAARPHRLDHRTAALVDQALGY